MNNLSGKVFIGPAGWSYKDWEGIVYPSQRDKNFDQLKYLSDFVNTIEINSPFYRPPAIYAVQKWVEKIEHKSDFMFTWKLWQRYTHEREQFPGDYEEKLVKQGLDVLKNKNRLGALLVQFPWSFKKNEENQAWLFKVIQLFRDYSPVVEIRHESWNNQDFMKLLNEEGAGFANIDQPVIGDSIALTSYLSGDVAYLRLHGRNYEKWFAKDATVASRYDYLYSEDELFDLKKFIEKMLQSSPKTYIIFNNHYRGQAVANSLQTMYILFDEKVDCPKNLLDKYPALEKMAQSKSSDTIQTSLF